MHTLGVTDTSCGGQRVVTAAGADALRPAMKRCGHWQALLCGCALLPASCIPLLREGMLCGQWLWEGFHLLLYPAVSSGCL